MFGLARSTNLHRLVDVHDEEAMIKRIFPRKALHMKLNCWDMVSMKLAGEQSEADGVEGRDGEEWQLTGELSHGLSAKWLQELVECLRVK